MFDARERQLDPERYAPRGPVRGSDVINFRDPTPRRSLTREDPSAFAAPAQFGPFRVLHQIGVGALGPVFRTYEPERDRLVAIKAFRLDIPPEQARALADELSRAAEAGLFHPSIVEPIAAGVEGTVAFSAEEYVAAESLDAAMRQFAPAPIGTVLPLITQLAGAVDFARAAGVGHGALHPRDIFITGEDLCVTGFGVVESLERVGLRAPVRRPYSPPERIAGQPWSVTADVFSLAAVTYELLTGRRPSGLGRDIGALTAGTPNAWMDTLLAVLARAMDPDPAARHQTALAFAAALEAAARGESVDPAVMATPAATPAIGPGAAAGLAAGSAVEAPLPLTAGDTDLEPLDIAIEREEDEAPYRPGMDEPAVIAAPVAPTPQLELDDDIRAEAEADRFAGDDFLLDAAGAASAPVQPAAFTDLPRDRQATDPRADASGRRALDEPVDPRALEDDEVLEDAAAAAPLFPADEVIGRDTYRAAGSSVAARAPSFGYAPLPQEQDRGRESRAPLVLTLLLGLLAGIAGGYAIWGRGTAADPAVGPSAGAAQAGEATPRDFSEAVVPADQPEASAPREQSQAAAAAGAGAATTTRREDEEPPAATGAPLAAAGGEAPRAAARPSTGTLTVRSTPAGAGVTIDGRWRGRTPVTVRDLPLRRHQVRVVQPGFQPATESVSLSGDTPERTVTLRLQQAARTARQGRGSGTNTAAPPPAASVFTGSVFVDSRPRGARVSIDGRAVGVTPVSVPEVRIGTHVVRLELPDHRIWSTTTTVTAGQEQRVTGSLERFQ